MKICLGALKGMRISLPKNNSATRPTGAKLREAFINIMAASIPGARVLDLFSGTGIMGLEFLSQGALECVFIENSKSSVKTIRENVARAKSFFKKQDIEAPLLSVVNQDVRSYLSKSKGGWDIIWADPPYDQAAYWVEMICKAQACKKNALILAMELPLRAAEECRILDPQWHLIKFKKYGSTVLKIWEYRSTLTQQGDS
jgi:16S rRNA (guanine966-N2)-methyltransferase